ncbi:MAG: agarase [Planctomycetes bacterium]|nr:agarase [Planctomycetota bacterium]
MSFESSEAAAQTTKVNVRGFFTVGQRNGRWWFITPEGRPFFSIGLNHIDSATLRYKENAHLWRDKYGNSMEKWLKRVRSDLLEWSFNTVGWVQEVVTRDDKNHRHSRNFTFEEYRWLNMPYCHMLPFVDFHQWENETKHPDISGKGFEDWCDYVARAECGRLADDPKLIGYFYSDCPTWVHIRKPNTWKGPLFDPEKLKSQAGRKELLQLASRYYKVTHDAIRRYDKNHLILGDRYEARAALPDEVVRAAMPYVDVLSFQCFGGAQIVNEKLGYWAKFSGRPILLADSAVRLKSSSSEGVRKEHHQDPQAYEEVMRVLQKIPECVGFHLCGAYICNRVRRYGLRDEQDRIDTVSVQGITRTNEKMTRWMNEPVHK